MSTIRHPKSTDSDSDLERAEGSERRAFIHSTNNTHHATDSGIVTLRMRRTTLYFFLFCFIGLLFHFVYDMLDTHIVETWSPAHINNNKAADHLHITHIDALNNPPIDDNPPHKESSTGGADLSPLKVDVKLPDGVTTQPTVPDIDLTKIKEKEKEQAPPKEQTPTPPKQLSSAEYIQTPEYIASRSLWTEPASALCGRQFGNGFSEHLVACDSEESLDKPLDNTLSLQNLPKSSATTCHYNERVKGSICEARNVVFDVDRADCTWGGESVDDVKGRREEEEIPRYRKGAWRGACTDRQPPVHPPQFPNHITDIYNSFEYVDVNNAKALFSECDVWISEPTLGLTRYEYYNWWHSNGDFYNAYQVAMMYNLDPRTVPIIILDGHGASHMDGVWTTLFGKITQVKQMAKNYANGDMTKKKFCFSQMLFVHPAWTGSMSPMMLGDGASASCNQEKTMLDYVDFFNRRYDTVHKNPYEVFSANSRHPRDLFDRPIFPSSLDLSKTPMVTIIFRRDYKVNAQRVDAKMYRKISNEREVYDAVSSVSYHDQPVHVIAVDFAVLTLEEQLLLCRVSNVVIGFHGAALSHVMFMPQTSVMIELASGVEMGLMFFNYAALWSQRHIIRLPAGPEQGNFVGHHVDANTLKNTVEAEVQRATLKPAI